MAMTDEERHDPESWDREALRLMRAVCDAAEAYRAAEQDGTPRLWKGKDLCDIAESVADAIAMAMNREFGAPPNTAPAIDCMPLATAALTAVLDATAEPTEEMIAAGVNAMDPTNPWCGDVASNVHHAMHAALRRNLTEKEG